MAAFDAKVIIKKYAGRQYWLLVLKSSIKLRPRNWLENNSSKLVRGHPLLMLDPMLYG